MLQIADLEQLMADRTVLGRPLNDEQRDAAFAPSKGALLVIAGPGSGKTTVLVARALKMLLVDGFVPEDIVITTFTKKAAAEIRTRWLVWGQALIALIRAHGTLSKDEQLSDFLERVDLNRCVTGTLDSICESMLGDARTPLEIPPTLVDQFTANQLLLRSGLREIDRNNSDVLRGYLSGFGSQVRTQKDMVEATRPMVERFVYDRVDRKAYSTGRGTASRKLIVEAFEKYQAKMDEDARLDFARLESNFLDRLSSGRLDEAIRSWKAVLVDEYQDTNPLQESIYFEIVKRSSASLTIVGDDDQSLYRFRGATVELFAAFAKRFKQALGKTVQRSYLVQNYRSTPEIVAYYNAFVKVDPKFSGARIQPLKSDVKATRSSNGLPVLGMFRDDADQLANSLATFINDVFRGKGAKVPIGGDKTTLLKAASADGNLGDAVLLASKVKEWQPGWGADPPKPRLPWLLRIALERQGIDVFNPRGQALRDQTPVQTLLGLLLECLDPSDLANPNGTLSLQAGITRSGLTYFEKFRHLGNALIAANPAPNRPHTLKAFVKAWNTQTPQTSGKWPEEWPLLELGFTLLTWLPSFLDNPEQQIWLEAITRTISQAALFSSYRSTLLQESPHSERSRTAAIRDVIRPIAEGLIDVEEDLVLNQPRDTFSIMTIHQAKGLEFPLVIVDVSSDFKRNHPTNAFRRFPHGPSTVTRLEDEFAKFCEVGETRMERNAMDRAFDDIVRQYYVAFSRPQSCLLLVGLNASLGGKTPIQNIATGWRRDGTWSWMEQTGNKKKPALANRLPFSHI